MLQTQTITKETFELLTTLMQDERLKHFNLVGGTALALYMGHRKSIDIDLFTQYFFDVDEIKDYLMHAYNFQMDRQTDATLIGHIDAIKIDCIRYNYPLVEPLLNENGFRIYSISDIAAMKLTAISQSGSRLKDFVDVAFMSTRLSLNDMLNAFRIKFPKTNIMSAIRGLTYYDDINFFVEISLIEGIFKWKLIEKRLKEMIKYPDKIFLKNPIITDSRK